MSAYLEPRAFESLRARLSERDLQILGSVSQHRFLSSRQIEALHFEDHASATAAARVARRVLARLTDERVIKRLQRRVGGVRAGSASYVYAVGPVGARLLGEPKRVTEPSELFLDHTLAIGDVRVALQVASDAGRLDLVELEVEPACWRRFVGPGGARDIVRPDLFALTAHGDFEDAWFIEVDRGTESPAALARKCHAYDRYWRSGREQAAHGAFPLVLWVAPDAKRAERIERVIRGSHSLKRELFRVTTTEQLVETIVGGAA